jgi:Lon protease-like protein
MDLPIFPLHTVLFPGIALPLHIFEPRYRLMIGRCLEAEERFGVVWIADGREVGAPEIAVATVGTAAEIREATRYDDGRYDLTAVGMERFRIEEVFTSREPYLVARVEPVEEVVGDDDRAARLAKVATRRFVKYVAQVREIAAEETDDEDDADEADEADDEPAGTRLRRDPSGQETDGQEERTSGPSLGIPADPTLLSHLLSGIVELDLPRRQALLEAPTTVERLEELTETLGREVAYLEQRLRVFTPDQRQLAGRRN